ncbi:tetratricopeptide repeat protein [Actinomadura algeriensis]|uniref:Type VI secretion system protein ImpK n=1 Tax=Actinomadura algeriensis TaxID=1679523 RepID=A0ABR9JL81_9ACTN|nr:tetratricopeptide repeat protein [Actinomadura algeriensis]MBE1531183.1 type VI secretion system protein ImpK [Actinomadura algeriensis]
MNGPAPAPASPARADRAAREAVLAQARTLARAGRYAEAEALLDGESGASVLDLRARMYAQQGRFDDADRCWAEAAALDPGDADAARGRARIAELRAKRASAGFGRALTAGLLLRGGAVLVALLAIVLFAAVWPADPDPAAVPAARTPPPSAAPPPAPADPLSELDLDVPGVRAERRGGEIAVTFERGLFDAGATLTPDGRDVLTALGERLRPHADRLAVAVIGHTDRTAVRPGGEYASNVEIGTMRATVAREVLRSSARIPTTRFTLSTLAGMLPPYGGDAGGTGAPGDPRNRTVSLRVSATGGR